MSDHLELREEFAEYSDKLHELKAENHHFQRLWDKYVDLDKQILKIEANLTGAADESLEDLKKHRLEVKDEIHDMLKAA